MLSICVPGLAAQYGFRLLLETAGAEGKPSIAYKFLRIIIHTPVGRRKVRLRTLNSVEKF